MADANIGFRIAVEGAQQAVGSLQAVGDKLGTLDEKSLKAGDAMKKLGGELAAALTVGAITAWIKSGIDAADEASKMASKIGVAVQDLAGLQLAFQLAGVEAGSMQTAMVKLSANMDDGAKVFGRLGVEVKNTDGTLRSSTAVLADVADKFSAMPDGVQKTALAVEIFGKAGADLIPLLNGGSDGLTQMADMAERLGLVVSEDTAKAAESFNDTLDMMGLGLQGVGRQVAAQILPTLQTMAGELLQTATQGDVLRQVADGLGATLKALYSIGVGLVQAFSTVGKTLGAAAAQVVAILRGDFSGAMQIGKEWAADISSSWESAGASISRVWEGAGNTSVATAAKLVGAGSQVKDSHEKTTKATKDLATAGAELAGSLTAQSQGLSGDFFDKQGKLLEAFRAGKIDADRLGVAMGELIKQQPYYKAGLKDQAEEQKAAAKAAEEDAKAKERVAEAALKSLSAADGILTAIERETDALQMSNTEREISKALLDLERTGLEKGTEAYQDYAEKIRAAIISREEQRESIASAKAAQEQWAKTSEQIGQSLTDSLFRAFESGRGFFSTLWSGIRNTIKTTVMRVAVEPALKNVAGTISTSLMGMFGLSGTANAASAGGGGLGGLGSLAQLGSWASSIGGAFGSGFAISTGGAGIGTALSSAGSLIGSGNVGMGLAQGLGAVAPYAMAAMAIYSIIKSFDDSGTPHMGGTAVGDASGARVTTGEELSFVVGRNKQMESQIKQLAGSTASALNAMSSAFGGPSFSVGMGFADDSSADASWGALSISRGGWKAIDWSKSNDDRWPGMNFSNGEAGFGEFQDAVARDLRRVLMMSGLPTWAAQMVQALDDAATMTDVLATVEAIRNTKLALDGIRTAFAPLGGLFANIAASGETATMKLAELVGGLDALAAKGQGFLEAYYSDTERAAITAASILREAQAAGASSATMQTLAGLRDRSGYRSFAESIDVRASGGIQQAAIALNAAQAFASISEILSSNNLTLGQLAARASSPALLSAMSDGSVVDAQAVTAVDQAAQLAEATTQSLETLAATSERTNASLSGLQSAMAQLAAEVVAWRAESGPLQTASAVVAAKVDRLLARWDVEGVLVRTEGEPLLVETAT